MRVVDGMHRLHAAARNGRADIQALFFDGSPEDAFIRAVEENITHGLPLSLPDRKAAAQRILTAHPQQSDRSIAARAGLSPKTVAAIRRRSAVDSPHVNSRIDTAGRQYPLDGSAGRLRASEIISARPDTPLRMIARDAGISVGTAHDVRGRVRRGEAPVPGMRLDPPPRNAAAPTVPPAAARSPCRDDAGDRLAVLRQLTRDPSLRNTESGLDLLRWLHTQAVLDDDWQLKITSVPPHCADAVAELARQCAVVWQQIAEEVAQRKYSGTSKT